ncbi:uncharacterized protein Bfra_008221 [Botrytis fragariae]|uniref:Uncharacterized protein n=1 Tax=Botrytis fragariae TaxID=1964551 RepID=A0A8H6AT01_9HELO|nr:uncharacterized protein Bfra_008221 [Botrytis fragariae]KAF5872944.1 hypothetical protein Bfra_008221 [Botrytis fragariae]
MLITLIAGSIRWLHIPCRKSTKIMFALGRELGPGIGTVWAMTAGSVGGVFWTTWESGLDASSLYTYLSLAGLFQQPLTVHLADIERWFSFVIGNFSCRALGNSSFISVQFLFTREKEKPLRLAHKH